MYVYIYRYIYVHVWQYICVCVSVCTYMYIYICMHLVYLFIDWLHVWKYLIFVGNIEEMSREGTIWSFNSSRFVASHMDQVSHGAFLKWMGNYPKFRWFIHGKSHDNPMKILWSNGWLGVASNGKPPDPVDIMPICPSMIFTPATPRKDRTAIKTWKIYGKYGEKPCFFCRWKIWSDFRFFQISDFTVASPWRRRDSKGTLMAGSFSKIQ